MDLNLFKEIKTIPPALDHKHYSSLNGLRAISIILVVLSHIFEMYTKWGNSFQSVGRLGVNIFFVISGFLITTLCIKEKLINGGLSLSKFYLRRMLRIMPVAYLYIAFVFIINIVFKLNISGLNFIAAALFLTNISYFGRLKFDWDLAHFWSLAVEEQFYILLPVFIKANVRLYTIIVLMLVLGVPVLMYLYNILPLFRIGILSSLLGYTLNFQAIGVGCLFSVFMFNGYLNFGNYKFIVSLFSIVMIAILRYHPSLIVAGSINRDFDMNACLSNLAVSVLTGFVITSNINFQNNVIYKFLNWKVMNFIGILSYSIYVWQQVFLSNAPRLIISKFPVNLLFLVVVPLLSYFFYERIFLNMKKHFMRKKDELRLDSEHQSKPEPAFMVER